MLSMVSASPGNIFLPFLDSTISATRPDSANFSHWDSQAIVG